VLVVGGTVIRGRLVGVDVVAAIEVVEVAFDVEVDGADRCFGGLLLLHAVSTTTEAIMVNKANRGRRTPRS
jgi:hypothetical protein